MFVILELSFRILVGLDHTTCSSD